MPRRATLLGLTLLGVSVLAAAATFAAPLGLVVDPRGFILMLDTETDTVVGMRQVPGLGEPVGASSRAVPGRSLLTPRADRIVVLDTRPGGLPGGFLIDEGPAGRVYVYDVTTGARLGQAAV